MPNPPVSPTKPLGHGAAGAPDAASSLEAKFQRITRLARRLFDAPIAALSLMDGEGRWFTSAQGLKPGQTACSAVLCGHTIQGDGLMIVPDARKDPRFARLPQVTGGARIVFYAGCPLKTPDGNRVATLCVIDHEPRRMTAEDERVLRDLAALAEMELRETFGQAVQEDLVSQIDAERRRVLVDPLTRLWSRAGIIERLADEHDRAVREGRPFALAMADLDLFKAINDTRGHPVGDEVLRQAARRMAEAVREGDTVGRHGGEEFLLVFGPVSSREQAVEIAECLRRRVGVGPVNTHDGPVPVTISIGVVFLPRAGQIGLEDLIVAADRAMYRAKERGRDRVEWVEVESGQAGAVGETRKAA